MTMKEPDSFGLRCARIVASIPNGKVATYGQVVALAGNPRGARLVVRVLWSMSERHNLPWHRVISSKGAISLRGQGGLDQRRLLEQEGVEVGPAGEVSLEKYQWRPLVCGI